MQSDRPKANLDCSSFTVDRPQWRAPRQTLFALEMGGVCKKRITSVCALESLGLWGCGLRLSNAIEYNETAQKKAEELLSECS